MRDYVTIVSGVPRSGTSLMMHMLAAGGLSALMDGLRQPDVHNPQGYFEYEPVKRLAKDCSWMKSAQGKAVKIIYRLLPHLPADIAYRVIFMERDLSEVFESQRDMLGESIDADEDEQRDRLISAFSAEIRKAKEWLAQRSNIKVLTVPYTELVNQPAKWSHELSRFLDGGLDESAMAAVVDLSLYRHRKSHR